MFDSKSVFFLSKCYLPGNTRLRRKVIDTRKHTYTQTRTCAMAKGDSCSALQICLNWRFSVQPLVSALFRNESLPETILITVERCKTH